MYLDETAWVAIAFILFIILVWKKGQPSHNFFIRQ